MNLLIDGYKLVLTCGACPEQYDVYDDEGTQVAYLRLRHGSFTACCPDVGGDLVFQAYPIGDGRFNKDERLNYLKKAISQVQDWIVNRVSNEDSYE